MRSSHLGSGPVALFIVGAVLLACGLIDLIWVAEAIAGAELRPVGTSASLAGLVLVAVGAARMVGRHRVERERARQARSRAEDAQRHIASVLELASEACIAWDADGAVRFANTAAHLLLGRAPDTLPGFAVDDLGLEHERDADWARMLGRPGRAPITFTHSDGSRRHGLMGEHHVEVDGRTRARVQWIEDVTDRVRDREEIAEMKERVRRSERLEELGTLAGGLAHDFNNLLAPIMGYVDLVAIGMEPESPLLEDLGQIKSATQRATELAGRLLRLARPERDQLELVDIGEIVREALVLLSASKSDAHVFTERLDPTCTPVFGTRTQLHQVVFNICKNALHAMPEGGTLSVSLNEVDALATWESRPAGEGPFVRLRIADTGTGMDEETLARIFEPFFTTKGEGSGSGLGLSMVKSIVADFDGTLSVKSSPGRGTTFTLLFPRGEGVAAGDDGDRAPSRPPAIGFEPVAATGRDAEGGEAGRRVLVIDDDKAALELFALALERLGFAPTTFDSSAHALESFSGAPDAFDLVLTDQRMPDLTGLELAGEILRRRPDVPVVLTTGHLDAVSKEEIERLGCQLLPKPVSAADLGDAIARALSLSRS